MHCSRQLFSFSIISILMIIAMGFLGISGSLAKDNPGKTFLGLVINPQEAKDFQLTARVMEIKVKPSPYIVVGEKLILITAYKLEDDVHHTELVNQYGSVITLEEIKVGERVIVKGLILKDGTIVGKRIEVKPKKK